MKSIFLMIIATFVLVYLLSESHAYNLSKCKQQYQMKTIGGIYMKSVCFIWETKTHAAAEQTCRQYGMEMIALHSKEYLDAFGRATNLLPQGFASYLPLQGYHINGQRDVNGTWKTYSPDEIEMKMDMPILFDATKNCFIVRKHAQQGNYFLQTVVCEYPFMILCEYNVSPNYIPTTTTTTTEAPLTTTTEEQSTTIQAEFTGEISIKSGDQSYEDSQIEETTDSRAETLSNFKPGGKKFMKFTDDDYEDSPTTPQKDEPAETNDPNTTEKNENVNPNANKTGTPLELCRSNYAFLKSKTEAQNARLKQNGEQMNATQSKIQELRENYNIMKQRNQAQLDKNRACNEHNNKTSSSFQECRTKLKILDERFDNQLEKFKISSTKVNETTAQLKDCRANNVAMKEKFQIQTNETQSEWSEKFKKLEFKYQNEMTELQSENDDLKLRNNQLTLKANLFEECDKKVVTLEERIEISHSSQIEIFNETKTELNKTIERFVKCNENVEVLKVNYQSQIEENKLESEKIIEELRIKIQTLNEQLKELSECNVKLSESEEGRKIQEYEFKEKETNLTTQLTEVTTRVTTIITEHKTKIIEKEEQYNVKVIELKQSEESVKDLEKKLHEQRSNTQQARNDLLESHERMRNLTSKLAEIKTNYETMEAKYQNETASNVTKLITQIKEYEEKIEVIEKRYRNRSEVLQSQVENKIQELSESEGKIAELSGRLNDTKNKLREVQQTYQQQIEEFQASNVKMTRESSTKDTQISIFQRTIVELESKITEMEHNLQENYEDRVNEQNTLIQNLTTTISTLEIDIETKTVIYEKAYEELERKTEEFHKQTTKVDELNYLVTRLQESVSKTQQKYQDFQISTLDVEFEFVHILENIQHFMKENTTTTTIASDEIVEKITNFNQKFASKNVNFAKFTCASNVIASECVVRDAYVIDSNIKLSEVNYDGRQSLDTMTITKIVFENQLLWFIPLHFGVFFTQLQSLTITNSQLIYIRPTDFKDFQLLQYLDLSDNQLKVVNEGVFCELRQLIYLDLSFNHIEMIEGGSFETLPALQEIKLNDNQVSVLKTNIFEFNSKLESLWLQNNPLTAINNKLINRILEVNFVNLLNANCIDVQYDLDTTHEVDTIREEIKATCSAGVDIVCDFVNDYKCDVVDLATSQERSKINEIFGNHERGKLNRDVNGIIVKNQQRFMYMPEGFEETFVNIESITIKQTNLIAITSYGFSQFSLLRRLSITNNANFNDISAGSFDSNAQLEEIDLSRNSLITLPDAIFARLSGLRTINLSYNRIISLNMNAISCPSSIAHFDISHNYELMFVQANIVNVCLKTAAMIDFSFVKCVNRSEYTVYHGGLRDHDEMFGALFTRCSPAKR